MESQYHWYAVYTKPRWEKKVAAIMEQRGIRHYCPLVKTSRKWSDRMKVVLEPVFKGYVFVNLPTEKIWDSIRMDGVLNLVRYLGKPAIIRNEEIITIRMFLNEFSDIEVNKQPISQNTRVRVRKGILMDHEGIVIEVMGNRAIVHIDSLGLELSAHFDKGNLESVN